MTSINRKELYKKVWETPITRWSKEYGLSDVGFAKICKKHKIPRPPRGYWARKATGQRVKRLPLPQEEDVTIEISPNPYSEGIVFPPKRGCLDISVSKASLRRALRI
jgi:hypothetical protein